MNQSLGQLDSFLLTIVLATLAIGLPVTLVLAIRFLWDRTLTVGRSKELEKLIWQLHRIASALEHQMNLSFPAVQPGTEEPRDLVYLTSPAVQSQTAAAPNAAAPVNFQAASPAAPQAALPAAPQASAQELATPHPAAQEAGSQPTAAQAATPQPAAPQANPPAPGQRPRGTQDAQRARVNSMFGFDR